MLFKSGFLVWKKKLERSGTSVGTQHQQTTEHVVARRGQPSCHWEARAPAGLPPSCLWVASMMVISLGTSRAAGAESRVVCSSLKLPMPPITMTLSSGRESEPR